jgi:two-component system response regulator DesR
VLDLIASGATNREIAEALHISPWTVKDYTGGVYRKLGVRNRTEAVQRAQRLGLLA